MAEGDTTDQLQCTVGMGSSGGGDTTDQFIQLQGTVGVGRDGLLQRRRTGWIRSAGTICSMGFCTSQVGLSYLP